ncbi:PLP-dependent aminotransferase family protein [Nocardioides sp. Kera G14]|uniref:MocR-like transcription factor YczR n=1 Tax=Nocardioides sp. Kera G14 TaxID=2884264 RepID=UPI001D10000A|nr:PLP-dependent aminotransferase family protein [Nocardioides sp. Kera G14]UDY24789.1 PLP-dependent aminotransferase family protein [Nocardioides sp. Kera G14]
MIRGRLAASTLGDLLGDWRRGGSGLHAYEALAERIRLLLIDGRISADVRLPSERELSERLNLSRTTITAAYRQLRDTGYARAVQGSGTTTTLPLVTPTSGMARGEVIDLTMASLPATDLLPEAARRATEELTAYYVSPGYQLVGLPVLREAIAARYTARGLPTEADQILVTNGAQGAIALLARTLVARGDRVFAESPSYPHAYDALASAGGRIVTSPVTPESGWDVPALTTTIARTTPVVAYTMPDFHNPTGRCMSEDDRHELLHAAAKVDTLLIADETTAELDIDRAEHHGPLAALAGEHGARVVQIGSASKLLWGGLRIGWIRASAEIIGRLIAHRPAHDLGTAIWEQLVVAELLGRTPEIVEERRGQLGERRTALATALATHLPDWQMPAHLRGGLAAWLQLPSPVSSQLTLAARAHGLHVTAGPRFGIDGAYERRLRLPLTAAPETLARAVEILGELWPTVANAAPVHFSTSEPLV